MSKPRWKQRRDRWRLLFVAVWPALMALGFVLDVPTAELVVGLVVSGLAGCCSAFLVFSEWGRRRLGRERYVPEIMTVRNWLVPTCVLAFGIAALQAAPDVLGISRWTTLAAGGPIVALCYGLIAARLARGERERQEAIVSNSEFRTPPRDERT
ncbi:hypothetical protein [Nocardioides zeae]|uniref:Transmembrane protein n=1 Tax=Nocardioides zeae TaxID=1457234 RepID=A0AAJ1TWV2_9ACTN|nr:hypothetical protein [Nocardioides zeae]MDQ1103460.1 hypothetical protein [Nocardioides zeae]